MFTTLLCELGWGVSREAVKGKQIREQRPLHPT